MTPGGDAAPGCKFCAIVAGTLDAEIVYSDDDVVAFLDHRPLFPGHTLVMPRAHVETLRDLPADVIGPFFAVVQRLAVAVQDAYAGAGHVRRREQRGEPERRRTSTCTSCPAARRTACAASSGPARSTPTRPRCRPRARRSARARLRVGPARPLPRPRPFWDEFSTVAVENSAQKREVVGATVVQC